MLKQQVEDINMIQFILAKQQDLEKIVGTYNASIPGRLATADLIEVSTESKQKWFDDHNEDKRPLWIITYNKQYAGWMSFSSFYGRPAYDATVEVSIYIEPIMQGKGIGKEALNYAEPEAKKRNIKTLLGFIFGHNEPSLILFYKQGYAKWAQLPEIANMESVLRDLIILGKKLV
jgi:phosphinothricin acetyltransferase